MFKKLAIIFVIMLIPAFASAEIPQSKVAVVDIAKVMAASTAVKQANDQLQSKRDEYQKEISAQEEKLKTAEQDLAKQKGILSKDAMNEKQKQFIEQIKEARNDVQVRKGKLDKAYREVLVKVQVAVRDIVAEMASEKGFNIALPTEPLIFAHRDLDITSEVADRLNKKLPSVSLSF